MVAQLTGKAKPDCFQGDTALPYKENQQWGFKERGQRKGGHCHQAGIHSITPLPSWRGGRGTPTILCAVYSRPSGEPLQNLHAVWDSPLPEPPAFQSGLDREAIFLLKNV